MLMYQVLTLGWERIQIQISTSSFVAHPLIGDDRRSAAITTRPPSITYHNHHHHACTMHHKPLLWPNLAALGLRYSPRNDTIKSSKSIEAKHQLSLSPPPHRIDWKDIHRKNNHEDNAAIDMPIINEHPPDEIRRRVAVAQQCHGSGCNFLIRIISMGVCA